MSRIFFNQHAHNWDSTRSEQNTSRLRQMAGRLPLSPGATLLDVGSGTGVFLPLLLSKIGESGTVVALDYAEEMLRIARRKYPDGQFHYLQGSATDIPIRNEIFDAVICYSCFPHFKNKPKALGEMHRVIKDGGRLYICHTQSRGEINHLHHNIPGVQHDMIPEEGKLKLLLAQAGFSNIIIDDAANNYLVSARK
ncbi:class I SAM-dependent methyltransferase [Chloroflexota bacterium]